MKNILFIQSSPRDSQSYSQRVAQSIVEDLTKRNRDTKVTVHNLAISPPPHVGSAFVAGLSAAPQAQTPDQAEALALSDKLIAELAAADIVVMSVPMHNLGIPSKLKAWIDHVVRAGRTFTYTANGPQGLVKGKRAIVVLASGVYSSGPTKPYDFQEPYLRAVLGFTDVDVVRVEGVAMGTVGAEKAVGAAMKQSRELIAQVA